MKNRPVLSVLMITLLLLLSEGYLPHTYGGEESGKDVRPAAVAGMFYPSSPTELREMVTKMLNNVPPIRTQGNILAAIAPHAGYIFSGGVAAYTHKLLSTIPFSTLIIIGHDTHRDAVAFTCPVDYFQTPLGKVPVDREMISGLHKFNRGIREDRTVHSREHTVEVHLPFLQVLGKQFKIVPILFGNPTVENCEILSKAIRAAAQNKSVLVLASADMSHYPPYDLAYKVDNATLKVLESLDVGQLFRHLARQEREASVPNLRTAMCAKGGVGTAVLFAKSRGANKVQILRYANSGDISAGDKRRVVGYSSALIVKRVPSTRGD